MIPNALRRKMTNTQKQGVEQRELTAKPHPLLGLTVFEKGCKKRRKYKIIGVTDRVNNALWIEMVAIDGSQRNLSTSVERLELCNQ